MNRRITELDGLRAIAVTLVFFNHFAPIKSAPWLDLFRRLGWVGVDIFFVLSGFLVTGILLKARVNTDGYYRNFYVRRSLRIFPLYYAIVTVTLVVMFVAKHGLELQQMNATWGNPAWMYAYLGNIRTAITNVSPPGYFLPMWSLHVEEQFYLIFPLLVLHLTRLQLRRLLTTAIVAAPVIRLALAFWFPASPLLQYMLFPCRMDSLALGGLVAIYEPDPEVVKRWKLPLMAGTFALLALAVETFRLAGGTYDTTAERTIGYSLFDFAFVASIILVLSYRGTVGTRWLNWKPLQYLGMISYGVYLFQFPAEGLVNRIGRFVGIAPSAWDGTFSKFLWVAGTCIVLSTISWYAWETKWLAIKDRFAGAPAVPRFRQEEVA
jgi:peptidoglycan/LPS O-acetylase OafA/YrhL